MHINRILLPLLAMSLLAGCATTVVRPAPRPDAPAPATTGALAGNLGVLTAGRLPADTDGYRPPLKLAVLLPLSGDMSRAALPVRDGLLAGYYAENRRRPEITFHDTAAGVDAAYDQAVANGADFVVGPLGRAEVDALYSRQSLPIPVLALNRGELPPPPGNASFALAPEDDGVAAAEYAISRGARRVLSLADGDDSMRRAAAAFRARFEELDGTVVVELVVNATPGAMGTALQTAATTDGGIDAVFLAVRPSQAGAIVAQLADVGLGGKLRIGTSALAGARPADTSGHALDGIAFPSDAWSVQYVAGLPSSVTAASMLATARGGAQRLFAFGYDAWLLTAFLERLATNPAASVAGATGTLRIDADGNVVRTPAWSSWNGSNALPLGNNPPPVDAGR